MHGLMMETPLLVTEILRHAVRSSPNQEVVTRLVEGGMHRYTFKEAGERIAQLAHALVALGVGEGDRVGVMGWNTHRQLELYYATAGIGAVCHTINPRLGPENAGYVMNHARDKVVFYDETFLPLVKGLAPHLATVESYIALSATGALPEIGDKPVHNYESLIEKHPTTYDWPEFDERTACGLCYTSGTTGRPKGVLYTHRSTVLHALVLAQPNVGAFDRGDALLPVVPMFHVNAWGVPYAALMMGVKLVMPGPGLDGESLYEIFESEQVAYALGVPTVWLNLLNYVDQNNLSFSSLKHTMVGGAALSERIIKGFERHGVRVRQGWGMTEMSPIGTTNVEEDDWSELPEEERVQIQLRQGKAVPFMQMRIVDDEGNCLPHDGESDGHLQVKSPWVLSAYYEYDGQTLTDDGWFDTGDVVVIHPDGRMQITDRAKDVIKSGGEWLSTIDIENAALSHPAVANAAVIGMPHPKWQERPLLIVEMAKGANAEPAEILEFTRQQLPKISWPDDVQTVETIPLGATGKVLKTELRKQFADFTLPTV
ncbi:acyl-CoA synthase [Parvularcula bermudensis HTCC2503]|uniref:Acyl-CoA synthase n=1 Tax=Parvularcula bermudensis (strain ATCC BAA-594 / HTCC2503 / KCTC 12087) TaxID=314260 RepID=E0TG66_PARBH|nr:long-chain fatty acid--CoA ligase [Parvularcula bermudensis]ADM10637.1 acyl-CoA synthase [Parvularcula bermudensis HTCC2503]